MTGDLLFKFQNARDPKKQRQYAFQYNWWNNILGSLNELKMLKTCA